MLWTDLPFGTFIAQRVSLLSEDALHALMIYKIAFPARQCVNSHAMVDSEMNA